MSPFEFLWNDTARQAWTDAIQADLNVGIKWGAAWRWLDGGKKWPEWKDGVWT